MSSDPAVAIDGNVPANAGETPRNRRQEETYNKVLAAGVEMLRESSYADLTVRAVAARAKVAPATAYTYFSSKNHLIAEVYLNLMLKVPYFTDVNDSRVTRVERTLRTMALMVADEPEVAAACTTALLSNDLDVHRLRLRIGTEFYTAFEEAIGGVHDTVLVDALVLAFSGALLQAGMGLMTYTEMGERLAAAVAVIIRGNTA